MPRSSVPFFNLPASVTMLAAALVLVHLLRLPLSADMDFWILAAFAFIPARYDSAFQAIFPGGAWGDAWTFVSYALLHGDAMHLIVNLVWMLAFGSAVARRFGAWRFMLLSVAAAAGGAVAHLAGHWGEMVPMVGASAAISGHMGAAVRFALAGPGLLGRGDEGGGLLWRPAVPLMQALRQRQVLVFVLVWFGINLLLGAGSVALPGVGGAIAWQAHLGGFAIGLLGFRLFDPVSRGWREPERLP